MTTRTASLTDFLTARLDEDEAAARAASGDVWEWSPWDLHPAQRRVSIIVHTADERAVADLRPDATSRNGETSDAEHIARHDPARVLAEVAAKRRMAHEADVLLAIPGAVFDLGTYWLKLLAQPYADHPDYDASWRL